MTTWMDPDGPDDSVLEAELRSLLNERADDLASETTPYDTILRKGRVARRRRTVALCAGAAVLAAGGPAAAIGLHQVGGGSSEPPAAVGSPPDASDTAEAGTESPSPTGSEGPGGPSDPERQLLDGITLEQAASVLERCAAEYEPSVDVSELRILLAWLAQGDDNRGDGPIQQVLAVSDDPAVDEHVQLVCSEDPDGSVGVESSIGEMTFDNGFPVYPDPNAPRYYSPIPGEWDLPFRWADFGLVVQPEVARVTVTHAGVTEEAILEEGYFVVAGTAEEQPDASPVVVGYDADGEVLYDSRQDSTYTQVP